jgi:hypothetical protein
LNGSVELAVPFDKIERFMFDKGIVRQTEAKVFRPKHRKGWLFLPDYEIVERYNSEIRGVLNYYFLAANFYKLNYFVYLMQYSCYATLAGKYNSSTKKIVAKYKVGKEWVVKYKSKNGATKEKRLVQLKDYTGKTRVPFEDALVKHRWSVNTNATIRARLQAGVCELCGSKENSSFEVHHVPKVKDLAGNELWEQIMKHKRRKTLVVCEECHNAIHA